MLYNTTFIFFWLASSPIFNQLIWAGYDANSSNNDIKYLSDYFLPILFIITICKNYLLEVNLLNYEAKKYFILLQVVGVYFLIYGLFMNGVTVNNGDMRLFATSILCIYPLTDKKLSARNFINTVIIAATADLLYSIIIRIEDLDNFLGKALYFNPFMCLLAIPLLNYLVFKNKLSKLHLLCYVLIIFLAIITSYRALLIAIIICAVPFIRSIRKFFKFLLLVSLAILFLFMIPLLNEHLEFMLSETTKMQGSIEVRLIGWGELLDKISTNPLWGSGIGSNGENLDIRLNDSVFLGTAHNSVLTLMYRFGMLGLILITYIYYKLYYSIHKKNSYAINFLSMGLVAMIIFSIFSPLGANFYYQISFLIGAAGMITREMQSE